MSDCDVTGRCNCGAVRFTVVGGFLGAAYCHCTVCQRRSGTAASASATALPSNVRFASGEDALRAWTSPSGGDKVYCGACGSSIMSRRRPDHPDPLVAIRLGVVDGNPGVRPTFRQFTAYAAQWEPIPDDGLPRYPEAAPAWAWSST